MTPDQLREWNATRPFPHPNEAQEIIFEGHRCVVMDPECYEECFKQAESHAAALEEIERLKGEIGRYMMANNTLAERAEKAEAALAAQSVKLKADEIAWHEQEEAIRDLRAERDALKRHAEAMANALKDEWEGE